PRDLAALPSPPTRRSSDLHSEPSGATCPARADGRRVVAVGLGDEAARHSGPLRHLVGQGREGLEDVLGPLVVQRVDGIEPQGVEDRKSTRLNSSHVKTSYA